ncbi:MAG TPA: hemolysin family protein [Pyrinomonadaceae bacterium]|nr:hemolysin family protein [Pyrinomonadaceae bacterium]
MLTVLNIVFIVVIVLANGFFVAAEFALVGVRRPRIETLAAGGDKRAIRLMRLLNNLNAYLSASQFGITLASLALALVGEPTIAALLEPVLRPVLERVAGEYAETSLHVVAFIIAYSILTSIHITVGEQAPKLLGLQRAEGVALWSSLPMELFYKTFRPFIRLLDWASARMVRPFGVHATADHASIYTEEELRQLVNISRQSGHLEEEEQRLIHRVLDFSEAEVREAMVPRTNVDALPLTASLEETKRAFRTHGYTRLPVYRERLDDIVGVLFRRDLEPFLEGTGGEFDLASLLHPPLFIPASARLAGVLRQMQTARTHFAIVVDEHGGMEGIVTLEDLLEEIVGEIDDEFDEEVRLQISEQPDGSYLLDGMLAVRDANRQFALGLPEDGSYTTLAGFLQARTGRLLQPGETVEHDGARFTVERVDRRRIRRVRFTPAEKSAAAES